MGNSENNVAEFRLAARLLHDTRYSTSRQASIRKIIEFVFLENNNTALAHTTSNQLENISNDYKNQVIDLTLSKWKQWGWWALVGLVIDIIFIVDILFSHYFSNPIVKLFDSFNGSQGELSKTIFILPVAVFLFLFKVFHSRILSTDTIIKKREKIKNKLNSH